ncbi:MAG: hypothetical protein A3G35_15065 [candidate division NC10 bacterium RIFCSPLOWO2_12_FULL_66_18]|nr:MAG: hypothetical protein A3G35_15065 [candidate division NC10 bacterium RIFCSPLOWO2_12_FULL_66_18]
MNSDAPDGKRGVSQEVARGAAWLIVGNLITKTVGFLAGVVAARGLLPVDFGVVAIGRTFAVLIQLLGNLGVGAFLIHQRGEVEEYCVAAFWMNLAAGVGLCGLQILAAPLVATYYGDPVITRIMWVIALGYLVTPLGSIHSILLQREMRFRAMTLRDLGLSGLASALTIAAVLGGLGLWSLVLPELVVGAAGVVLNWWLHPWRPRLRLSAGHWPRIFRYGRYLLGDGLLAFLNNNADYMIIGKILGPTGLGLYSFAYQRSMIVPDYLAAPVTSAAFPALAKVQHQRDALAHVYYRLAKATALLVVPAVVLQGILAQEFVVTLYGAKWSAAVLAMQLLLPYALTRGLCVHLGTLLNAVGRPDVGFKYSVAALPFLVSAVFIGAHFGVNGAAMATGIVFGLTGPILTAIVFRTMGWSFWGFVESSRSALVVAAGMGVGVWGIRALVPEFAWRTSGGDLALFGLLGLLLFASLLFLWDRDAYSELMGLLRKAVARSA